MSMVQVIFEEKMPMVEGTVTIDGFPFPMDFIEYLPKSTPFEYYCNYGTYTETGTFTLTKEVTTFKLPMNKLEFNSEIPLVSLDTGIDRADATIIVYPIQLIDILGGDDLNLFPEIEIIDGVAKVPEIGSWSVTVYIEGQETITQRTNTSGKDVDMDIPVGPEIPILPEVPESCHLSVTVSPISAIVKIRMVDSEGEWLTSSNNYFQDIPGGIYTVDVSNSGYISRSTKVTVSTGVNRITVNLFSQTVDDDDEEEPDYVKTGLPPSSYNDIFVADRYDRMNVIPMTNTSKDIYSMVKSHNKMWNEVGTNNVIRFDKDVMGPDVFYITGQLNFKKESSVIILESIEPGPWQSNTPYKTSAYIDLHNMQNKYVYMHNHVNKREKKFNITCSISNSDLCKNTFDTFDLSYESADLELKLGSIASGDIGDIINTEIVAGCYTLVITLYDKDGDSVKVPITPERFVPHEDMNIVLEYKPHIKVHFKPGNAVPGHSDHMANILLSADNATNLLTSSIFEDYGYTDSALKDAVLSPQFKATSTVSRYVQDNGGKLDFYYITKNTETNEVYSYPISKTGITNGSSVNIDSMSNTADVITLPLSVGHNYVFRYTPYLYSDGQGMYYGGSLGMGIRKNKFADINSITKSNIADYTMSHSIVDASYVYESTYLAILENGKVKAYNNAIMHDTVYNRRPDKKVNVKIAASFPGTTIIVNDANLGSQVGISKAETYMGNSKIYKSNNMFDMDLPDNAMYTVTIYKRGYGIRVFSFITNGDDIILEDLNLYGLDEMVAFWAGRYNDKYVADLSKTDIEFILETGSSMEVRSIEPNYTSMVISGNKITGVPKYKDYKINIRYTPPKNIKGGTPVDLTIGGTKANRLYIDDKPISIVVNKDTGAYAVNSTISIYPDGSPDLTNRKIVVYGGGKHESINLTSLPKDIDIYGFSDDMYIEMYDDGELIKKNHFLLSENFSDIKVKVPNGKLNTIKILPNNTLNKRGFVAWEERDNFTAPYYPDNIMNKYTKYNIINPGDTNIEQKIYGNTGDKINYKVCIDGYDEYEGWITVSDDMILDISTLPISSKVNKSARYYGLESPNIEYLSVILNNDQLESGDKSIYNEVQQGPIVKSVGSIGAAFLDKTYSIPMFDSTSGDIDIFHEKKFDYFNTTTNSNDNGIIKAYYDDRYNNNIDFDLDKGLHASNLKYPFTATVGELLPKYITIGGTFMPKTTIQMMVQDGRHAYKTYLFSGRYKYFTYTSYGMGGYKDDIRVSGNRIYYSAGDVLIKEGANIATSDKIVNNKRITPLSSDIRMNKLLLSYNEKEQVQYMYKQNVRFEGGSFEEEERFVEDIPIYHWGRVHLKDRRTQDAGQTLRVIGSNKEISYEIRNAIKAYSSYVPTNQSTTGGFDTIDITKDRIIFMNPNESYNTEENFGETYIDISEKKPKNELVRFRSGGDQSIGNTSDLSYIGNGNSTIRNAESFRFGFGSQKGFNYGGVSRRYYTNNRANYDPKRPFYYKIPHGDIVSIICNNESDIRITRGGKRYTCNILLESPISYGISTDINVLDRTVLHLGVLGYTATRDGHDQTVVSGEFPMKIPMFIEGIAPSNDLSMTGELIITEDMVVLTPNGYYTYSFSMDDVTITSEEVVIVPDNHDRYLDPDGRIFTGEYKFYMYDYHDGLGGFDKSIANGYGNDHLYIEYKHGDIYLSSYDKGGVKYSRRTDLRYVEQDTLRSYPGWFSSMIENDRDKYESKITGSRSDTIYGGGLNHLSNLEVELFTSLYKDLEIHNKTSLDPYKGILNTSIISFKNMEDVKEIYVNMLNYTGISSTYNTRWQKENDDMIVYPNRQYVLLYGPCHFTFIKKDNTAESRIVHIKEPTTIIEAIKPLEFSSIPVELGSYKFNIKEPSGTTISNLNLTVQGKFKYTGHSETGVPIGDYMYSARLNGYMPIYGAISITKNNTTTVNLSFEEEGILNHGTVNFTVTPKDAKVYVKNAVGSYVRIRASKQSLYIPYGNLEYMIDHDDRYVKIEESIMINEPHTEINIQMDEMPPKKYTISFIYENPRHGIVSKAKITSNYNRPIYRDWFETKEFTTEEDAYVLWSATAPGYNATGGGFLVTGDFSIIVDMTKTIGALFTSSIPTGKKLTLIDMDTIDRKPFPGSDYMPSLPYGNYKLLITDDENYTGLRYYGDSEILFTHNNPMTSVLLHDTVKRLTGIINVTISGFIPTFLPKPVTRERFWADGRLRDRYIIDTGRYEEPTGKFRFMCNPYNEFQPYDSGIITLGAGEEIHIDIVFDKTTRRLVPMRLVVLGEDRQQVLIGGAYVQAKFEGTSNWVHIPQSKDSTDYPLPEGPMYSEVQVRVSAAGHHDLTDTIVYDEGRYDSYYRDTAYVYMVTKKQEGYVFPLYPEKVDNIRVSNINKNKEYNNYSNIKYDGKFFGQLPITKYPREYGDNIDAYFEDKFRPIILSIDTKESYGGVFPIIINKNRRETFVVSSKSAELSRSTGYIDVELNQSAMDLAFWEWSNSIYTLYTNVDGYEDEYRLTHSNRNKVRFRSYRMSDRPRSIGARVKRHDNTTMLDIKMPPLSIYNTKGSSSMNISLKSTWRENGLWGLYFAANDVLQDGRIYFLMGNGGNVIAEQLGLPTHKRWVEYKRSGYFNKIGDYIYMIEHSNEHATSIPVTYMYVQDGYEPYIGTLYGKADKRPTTSYFPSVTSNHVISIDSDTMAESLLGYQRNAISDPVKVTFTSEDRLDIYTQYKIYNIYINGEFITDHPLLYKDVTGSTVEFPRDTILSINISGVLETTELIKLDEDHTHIGMYKHIADHTIVDGINTRGPSFLKSTGNKYNEIKVRFNISKFNPADPRVPDENLRLNEFDEIVVMAMDRSIYGPSDTNYFVYRVVPINSNIMTFTINSRFRNFSIAFRKRGYFTILTPLEINRSDLNVNSTPIRVSLPTLHPVTE